MKYHHRKYKMLEYVIPYLYSHLLIVFQDMYIPPMPPTTAGPTTTTTPQQPPPTTIQRSKETHETPVTTHDPNITTMATKEATKEFTTTEPEIAKRKNDSKCLLYRIICFFGIKYFHTRYALLMILFLKTSITNLEIFAIRILI